jgi:hypothetical protein
MNSEVSNPFSTGGGGQLFEAKVQASFLLHLLIGGRVPCLPSGSIQSIRLQAKQAGFNIPEIMEKGSIPPSLINQKSLDGEAV